MTERSEEEKKAIVNKVCDAIGCEALALKSLGGHNKAVSCLFEYLMSNDEESFIRLYDILRGE